MLGLNTIKNVNIFYSVDSACQSSSPETYYLTHVLARQPGMNRAASSQGAQGPLGDEQVSNDHVIFGCSGNKEEGTAVGAGESFPEEIELS